MERQSPLLLPKPRNAQTSRQKVQTDMVSPKQSGNGLREQLVRRPGSPSSISSRRTFLVLSTSPTRSRKWATDLALSCTLSSVPWQLILVFNGGNNFAASIRRATQCVTSTFSSTTASDIRLQFFAAATLASEFSETGHVSSSTSCKVASSSSTLRFSL